MSLTWAFLLMVVSVGTVRSLSIPTNFQKMPLPKFRKVENADFSRSILGNVNQSVETIFLFSLKDFVSGFNPLETKIRVKVYSPNTTELENAVHFAIIYGDDSLAMKVPYILENRKTLTNETLKFSSATRVLCIDYSMNNREGGNVIQVRVYTHNKHNTHFGLHVYAVDDMSLTLGKRVRSVISVTAPDFFAFTFTDDDTDNVLVKVTAEKQHCMILAIQKAECPAFVLEESIRFQGDWQTFLTKGGLTVKKSKYPKGFFLKIIMTKEESTCIGIAAEKSIYLDDQNGRYNRLNPVTVEIVNNAFELQGGIWTWTFFWPALSFLVGTLVAVPYLYCYWKTRYIRYFEHRGVIENAVKVNTYLREVGEADVSSRQFWKVTIYLSIFYAVPVFELTAFNLQVLHNSGDYDMCYFNNLCSRPIGWIEDFNHVWSNISFVILGILFCCITFYKDNCYRKMLDELEEKLQRDLPAESRTRIPLSDLQTHLGGIPLHFGLFYAMGLALAMEGLMSSAYHLCPNKANFPYDTCFMYIIAVLCLLKMYENRHSAHLGPNWTFTILSGLSLTSVVGLALEKYNFPTELVIFKVILTLIHAWIAVMFLLTYLTDHATIWSFIRDPGFGTLWINIKTFPRVWGIVPDLRKLYQFRPLRFVFTTVLVLLSIVVSTSLFYPFYLDDDLANHILIFLILYLTVYFCYYIVMKEFHKRYWRCWFPILYLIGTCVFGSFAIVNFRIDLTEWKISASESRMGNEDCILQDFYDQHDLWHILSAYALFFFFMTLLSVDDAVSRVSRDELYTF